MPTVAIVDGVILMLYYVAFGAPRIGCPRGKPIRQLANERSGRAASIVLAPTGSGP